MGRERLPFVNKYVENEINLNAVITDSIGDSIKMSLYKDKSIYVIVSGNTGAVTLNIEGSNDNTNWVNIRSTTYTAENKNDVYSTSAHFQYIRTTTTDHTDATVTTAITGRT